MLGGCSEASDVGSEAADRLADATAPSMGALAGVLEEDNDAEVVRRDVLGLRQREFKRRAAGIRRRADALDALQDGDVAQRAAAVLAALDLGGGRGLNHGSV